MAECSAGTPGSHTGTKSPLYTHSCSSPAQDMLPDVQVSRTTTLRAYVHACMNVCMCVYICLNPLPPPPPPLQWYDPDHPLSPGMSPDGLCGRQEDFTLKCVESARGRTEYSCVFVHVCECVCVLVITS